LKILKLNFLYKGKMQAPIKRKVKKITLRQCISNDKNKGQCLKEVSMIGQLFCKKHGGEEQQGKRLIEIEPLGGIPTCEALSIETGERCPIRLTHKNDRTGEGMCPKHKTKPTKRVALNADNENRFRGHGIRWDLIFVSGMTALLHTFDSDQDSEELLRRGLKWISQLAIACDWNGLSTRELFIWFSQESYDSEMTLALLKGMGSKPLTWLLSLHERLATDEQKKHVNLFMED
jgi:hypothetical protein